jgi:large subunit ribosomal protein L3
MPTVRQPRSGSMQYWPRKRAKRHYARVKNHKIQEGLSCFAGYKVGMTQILAVETNKNSHAKGEEISIPVTIIECPPMRIASVRFYKKSPKGLNVKSEILLLKREKDLSKKIKLPKEKPKTDFNKINPQDYDDIRLMVYTQPSLTGIGKKKPEVFEICLGGTVEDKFNYIKNNADKEIYFNTVFQEGQLADTLAITKGKGFQGPVRRFGISLRQKKSEKSIRNPGSLGPWCAQGHIMWRVSHAAKTGFYQRTEYNKQILKVINDPKEINPAGGFVNYGLVKNICVLVKGSVPGNKKRLIIMNKPIRHMKKPELPTILEISRKEQQGN